MRYAAFVVLAAFLVFGSTTAQAQQRAESTVDRVFQHVFGVNEDGPRVIVRDRDGRVDRRDGRVDRRDGRVEGRDRGSRGRVENGRGRTQSERGRRGSDVERGRRSGDGDVRTQRQDAPWEILGGRDDDSRANKRGKGPKFCRNGEGHPVHGRQWCADKGFGLGDDYDVWGQRTRQERTRQERRRQERTILDDILGRR